MFDYHVHTNYSGDCQMPMEDAIQKGITLGLKELCFTDHIDFDYPDSKFDFSVDYNKYIPHFMEAKEKYKDKITLRLGIEIGLQSHVYEKCSDIIAAFPFDWIDYCDSHRDSAIHYVAERSFEQYRLFRFSHLLVRPEGRRVHLRFDL